MTNVFRRLARVAVAGLAAIGLIVVLVTLTPVVTWWATAMAGPWTDPNGDSLIVLGGAASEGVMGDSSYRRAVYAVLAYQQGTFHHIVLSGGGDSGRSIAEVMKEYMVCRGVPPEAIIVGPASNNTRENALFTKPLVAKLPGTKVLLTSDYHMTRAYRAFAKAGIQVLPRPFPDALKRATSPESRWCVFVDLARETAALGYYFARGWI